ncbi:Glycosyl hydrolase, family 13, all-beta [Penicillium roqueforti FM164]|uniref:Glycosyl hydrolase, family 13, all-beta n=1 Tax=Penicillium roqueforti (strain FM164) TaxID=1365484 RepID=W6Q1V6_PENRF|nr:Glycosyl hydrolase, family 13, all-beta [Penicillium roqueforti FM164]
MEVKLSPSPARQICLGTSTLVKGGLHAKLTSVYITANKSSSCADLDEITSFANAHVSLCSWPQTNKAGSSPVTTVLSKAGLSGSSYTWSTSWSGYSSGTQLMEMYKYHTPRRNDHLAQIPQDSRICSCNVGKRS